jgi:short-subunit dehydrogenase
MRARTVVVTGASSGIGEATARALARIGTDVVLAARREDRLRALAEELERDGGRALPVRCDVTDRADLARLREEVKGTFGRCDVLVNNAGIPGGGRFVDLTLEQMDRVAETNFLSVVWATKEFLPLLRASRGHVVNVASLAGRYAVPGSAVYTAAKHAVVALSEALYHELAPLDVMVTVVNPGLVETEGFPMTDIKDHPQLGRLVMRPERVARSIVDVIRRRRGPEVSVPRWLGGLQAARVLTPPLYRAAVRRIVAARGRATPAPEGPTPTEG